VGRVNDHEQRLRAVESRNRRVEGDKAWETSWTRRLVISVLTYLVVLAYNAAIGGQRPFLTALVPVAGFLLSTLTIPLIKCRWLAHHLLRKDTP
jgi:hypothetical protein